MQERSLPEKACLLTFDDGLLDQFDNALPVLESEGVQGTFFVCSGPLYDNKALLVHMMHWLRATRSPVDFRSLLESKAGPAGISLDGYSINEIEVSNQYQYDDIETGKLKFLLNHLIPENEKEILVNKMFNEMEDQAEFCKNFYMSKDNIKQLSLSHSVGSHTHSHRSLTKINIPTMQYEVSFSKSYLESILGISVELISYPFGGPTAISEDVEKVVAKVGYLGGITMERTINQSLKRPLLLSRLSTNDAPGGKTPRLRINHMDELESDSVGIWNRNQHFQE
tara:strand:- start:1055 stop:1900 length:846 start_codon:yes stop_codon:yes gene_type:complete